MPRPIRLALLCLLASTLACNTLLPTATPTPRPTATLAPTVTAVPTQIPTLASTATATVAPTPTADPASQTDLYIGPGDVLIHPDPQVYAGDMVSVEVFAHDGANLDLSSFKVALYLGDPKPENRLGVQPAYNYGLGGRLEASFTWVWDTTNYAGKQTLTAIIDSDNDLKQGDENKNNNTLAFTVNVLPRSLLPQSEQTAHWVTTTSTCCIFHYLSGTAAARDINTITATADEALKYVETKMGHTATDKMEFNLINRLLGQGGFTSDTVTISYLDRDYAGGGLENVFRHEATHALNRPSSYNRPALIEEGTATYIAGGHFKEEPFEARMVGLLALGRYIPLTQLANDFYDSQHETGYLEGAAFIHYLIKTYGWQSFANFLVVFQRADTPSATLDAGLRVIYDKSLAQIESEWLAHLHAQTVDVRWQTDVELTIAYYDTMRHYQQVDDPSAYFLTAWIPDIDKAVQQNIIADYDRHPNGPANIALETLLIDANRALDAGDFDPVRTDLAAVNAVLDAGGDFGASPLATSYLSITHALLDAGYEPQSISLRNNVAAVLAYRVVPLAPTTSEALVDLTLQNSNGLWTVN